MSDAQPTGNNQPAAVPPPLPTATLEYFHPNRAVPAGAYWREGMALRAGDGAVLPRRCVKCNSTDGLVMKPKTFSWFPRWTLFLLLLNLLVFAIVAVCLQKKATVTFGLCAKHRRKKALGLTACLLLLASAIGGFALAGVHSNGYFAIAGLTLLVASIVVAIIWAGSLRCSSMRDGVVWLKGAGANFLSSLDQGPAPQVSRQTR